MRCFNSRARQLTGNPRQSMGLVSNLAASVTSRRTQARNASLDDQCVNGVRSSWRKELEEDAERRAPSFEQKTWYHERRETFMADRRPEKAKPRAPSPPPRVCVSRRPSFSSDDSSATDVEVLSDVEVPDFSGLDIDECLKEQKTGQARTVIFTPVFEKEVEADVERTDDEPALLGDTSFQIVADENWDSDIEALTSEVEFTPVKKENEKAKVRQGPPRRNNLFNAITDGDADSEEEEVKSGLYDEDVDSKVDASPAKAPPRGDTFFRTITDEDVESEEELQNGIADEEVDSESEFTDIIEVDDSTT